MFHIGTESITFLFSCIQTHNLSAHTLIIFEMFSQLKSVQFKLAFSDKNSVLSNCFGSINHQFRMFVQVSLNIDVINVCQLHTVSLIQSFQVITNEFTQVQALYKAIS